MQKRPVNRQSVISTASVPAPVGGWNTRDALSAMPPNDAIIMENFFPTTESVMLRKGSLNHVTGITGTVETLMSYANSTSKKMFAAAGSQIYDATVVGVAGAASVVL